MVFKKKQTAVDEQIAEIDKLNAVINAAERDMLKLRKVSPILSVSSCPQSERISPPKLSAALKKGKQSFVKLAALCIRLV